MSVRKKITLSILAALFIGAAISQTTTYWTQSGSWSSPRFNAVSTAIGGSLLLLGGCQSSNVTITGVTTAMTAVVSPATDPGNAVQWQAFVSANDTVTVRICALASVTPTSTTYNVKVLQ